jgi:chaperone required for assembly of F1-ATPase
VTGPGRRFYAKAEASPDGDAFSVLLDGKALKTPAGAPFRLSTRALAVAVAREWAAQSGTIRPSTMPLTQLVATAIDRMPAEREGTLGHLMAFAETDLLCHRASHPADLVARQRARWDPLLDWAADTLGARLTATEGVLAVAQPPESLEALRRAVDGLSDLHLAAVASVAAATGSLIVALALGAGRLDAASTLETSLLDERYQAERWGEDAEAVARRARLRLDIEAAGALVSLSSEYRQS